MTAEELKKDYQSCKRQIERLAKKIDSEYAKELTGVNGKVIGSSPDFPYTERMFKTVLNDPAEEKARDKKIRQWQSRMGELQQKIDRIESFIDKIADEPLKELFTYYITDGMSQWEIAKVVDLERSSVSKKITGYLKIHTIHNLDVL